MTQHSMSVECCDVLCDIMERIKINNEGNRIELVKIKYNKCKRRKKLTLYC